MVLRWRLFWSSPVGLCYNSFDLGVQTGCESLTGNYLQEIMVDYSNPDQFSTLNINGSDFDVSEGEKSFLLEGLTANGARLI